MPEGKLQRNSSGKLQRNADGKLVRNSASSTDCCCTGCDYYRIRRCCDDTYVDFAMAAADIPQFPFTFVYTDTGAGGGECWYINSANECTDAVTYTVISVDDTQEYADCDDCRGTCNECASGSTCGCCADCDGDTPTEFTVTFSGVTLALPGGTSCYAPGGSFANCSGTDYFSASIASWGGGTITLTQRPGNSCAWDGTADIGTGITVWNNSDCTGASHQIDQIDVTLICTVGGWLLFISLNECGPDFSLFQASGFDIDCCGQTTILNEWEIANIGSDNVYAYGGQAVITPC